MAAERSAALVDNDGWGLGVFKDDGGEFHGGIYGDGRSDDPKHGSTAYVASIQPVTQPRPGEEMALKSVILSAERK